MIYTLSIQVDDTWMLFPMNSFISEHRMEPWVCHHAIPKAVESLQNVYEFLGRFETNPGPPGPKRNPP